MGIVDREAVAKLMDGRRKPPSAEAAIGNERIDIELKGKGNGPFVCRRKEWEFSVDEPPQRGGEDTAPNPLVYFLAGAASCLLSHWMLHMIEAGVAIDSLALRGRMRYDRSIAGGKITHVSYDIDLRSGHDPVELRGLCERAEAACYAHNTLGAAGASLTTNVRLNGEDFLKLVAGSG